MCSEVCLIMQETLGWEDPLEKETATQSSILSGESHGQRSLVGYRPWGCKELDMTERVTHIHKLSNNLSRVIVRFK